MRAAGGKYNNNNDAEMRLRSVSTEVVVCMSHELFQHRHDHGAVPIGSHVHHPLGGVIEIDTGGDPALASVEQYLV